MSTSIKKFRIIKFKKENPIIEFKNVSFKYKDQKEPVLRNVNMTIKKGQK